MATHVNVTLSGWTTVAFAEAEIIAGATVKIRTIRKNHCKQLKLSQLTLYDLFKLLAVISSNVISNASVGIRVIISCVCQHQSARDTVHHSTISLDKYWGSVVAESDAWVSTEFHGIPVPSDGGGWDTSGCALK